MSACHVDQFAFILVVHLLAVVPSKPSTGQLIVR
jgi:hypothetical protein